MIARSWVHFGYSEFAILTHQPPVGLGETSLPDPALHGPVFELQRFDPGKRSIICDEDGAYS